MAEALIFKILTLGQWRAMVEAGACTGAPVDVKDGYIHFSTAAQLAQTAMLHFAGQADLMLVTVEAELLGPALKWEPSRGGDLFPHLYAELPMSAVARVDPLPLGPNGVHQFPLDLEIAPAASAERAP